MSDVHPDRRNTLAPGMEIGGYILIDRLGEGGAGEVWLVVHPALEEPLAMKLLKRSDDRAQAEFLAEAKLMAKGICPEKFIPVRDYGSDKGYHFIVMTRIDGVNLKVFRERLLEREERIPISVVVWIFGEVLEALGNAHRYQLGPKRAGVIHSDVKPANIIVSATGNIWVADLGIARFATQTLDHVMRGTIAYMAPEQLYPTQEQQLCLQTDIFGAGAVLHFMLTGEPPVSSLDFPLPELLSRLGSDPNKLVKSMWGTIRPTGRDDVPVYLEAIRRSCLAPRASERLPAETVLDMLAEDRGRISETKLIRQYYANYVDRPHTGLSSYHAVAVRREANKQEEEDTHTAVFVAPSEPALGDHNDGVPLSNCADSGPLSEVSEAEAPWLQIDRDAQKEAEVDESVSTCVISVPQAEIDIPPAIMTKSWHTPVMSDLRRGTGRVILPKAIDWGSPRREETAKMPPPPPTPTPEREIPIIPPTVVLEDTPAKPSLLDSTLSLGGFALCALVALGAGFYFTFARTGSESTIARAEASVSPRKNESIVVVGRPAPTPTLPGIAKALSDASAKTTPSILPSPPDTFEIQGPPLVETKPDVEKLSPAPKIKKPRKVVKKPRIAVFFFLPKGVDRGSIRVAGRTRPVNIVAAARLSKGRHPMKWRADGVEKWTKAGTLQIDRVSKDLYYEVRLQGGSHTKEIKQRGGP